MQLFGDERENRRLVALEDLPQHLVNAVLAAEDGDFYSHHGVAWKGILRAVWVNLTSGGVRQGGSTITQQLAKSYFLSPERTLRRKLKELWIAAVLESSLSKDEILETYLNELYLGQQGSVAVQGMEAAARCYFGKSATHLVVAESATLAGLIKAPNAYSPHTAVDKATERRNAVLQSMHRRGWIEKDLQSMTDSANYEIEQESLWKRLRGVQKLKGEKLQIASDLCRWREQLAQRQNRPRRWIAKDDAIIEMARQKPTDMAALSNIPELSDKTVKRHGEKLLKIISAASDIDPSQWPRHDKMKTLDTEQMALGDCLMGLCRMIAEQNDIALATLATRKDIDNLILNQKSSRLTQGWRFAMAGEQLLEFIHGQSAISVAGQAIKLEPN